MTKTTFTLSGGNLEYGVGVVRRSEIDNYPKGKGVADEMIATARPVEFYNNALVSQSYSP